MKKTVFVPLTDELLYEHPELILGPLIPFSQQARLAVAEVEAFESALPQGGATTASLAPLSIRRKG